MLGIAYALERMKCIQTLNIYMLATEKVWKLETAWDAHVDATCFS